ncbi:MAG: DUF29 domain-containing protein [Chroococcidiopsidaceae cyanobacterium CP_BM_ER_R8_30]|nr:DUF29 domain-containing protein [Chroococcidiopsidaceae cyanobacterium CP_BM_ER_R8_30]
MTDANDSTLTQAHYPPSLYETDFYGWTQRTAKLLRDRDFDSVDWDNVIEEIETLGRSERAQLVNRLEVLLVHLLKWEYQSLCRRRSWELTIKEQRSRVERLLKENPSLRPYLNEAIAAAYEHAIYEAERQTKLPYSVFPMSCPYLVAQIVDPEFPFNQNDDQSPL